MVSYCTSLFAVVFVFTFLIEVNGGPWLSPALEKMDEVDDAEIYQAVLTSVQQWEIRQNLKKRHREKRQTTNICYKDIGCFESAGPYAYLDVLPSTPEEISTKFFLYPGHRSRRNGVSHAEIPFSNVSDAFKWAQQGFNKTLPTKVLIHGFGSDCTHIWVYELRSALMAVEEMNIICVDWEKGAVLPNYVKAAANTRLVGKQLAVLLKGLVEQSGLLPKDMHLIGFSLGAHVAGFAGAELGNLSRITGLDPAGPLFESQDPRARLDQTDADFVDVIHSNGENLILGGLGCWQPLGHVDFYPNGGRMQKGCSNIFVGAVSDIIWSSAVEGRSLCNHRRAYKFFTDSVSPRCHFPAFQCDSYEKFLEGNCFPCTEEKNCGNMGYYADRANGRGKLYLITRDEEPFCAHQYHVKIESSLSDFPITSYGKIQITLVGESDLNETFIMTRKDDDEMKLGRPISRILVPHPVLAEPTHIQLLYTAYSGWLSSGLGFWKIDKITLSDSYGKSSSVCKRSLMLESGIPITLPLYPGQCNLPTNDQGPIADDRVWNEKLKNTSYENNSQILNFVPTPVIKIGNEIISDKTKIPLTEAMEIFGNLRWQQLSDEKSNRLDDEKESSRALNTRLVKLSIEDDGFTKSASTEEIAKEIVEPVLKVYSNKNARSHDPNKIKPEISEPILGPTTNRIGMPLSVDSFTKKEISYSFGDSLDSRWIPSSIIQNEPKSRDKWKRQDNSNYESHILTQAAPPGKLDLITMTVQFLPQRLAKMFEEAERYARETILPFVSAHTPKIIRDFIAPEEKPKYLPLPFDETYPDNIYNIHPERIISIQSKNEQNARKFDLSGDSVVISTTPYTNIQKILKREELTLVYPESTTVILDNIETPLKATTPKVQNKQPTVTTKVAILNSDIKTTEKEVDNKTQEIYVDLPVFDKNYKTLKYIPFITNEDASRKK